VTTVSSGHIRVRRGPDGEGDAHDPRHCLLNGVLIGLGWVLGSRYDLVDECLAGSDERRAG